MYRNHDAAYFCFIFSVSLSNYHTSVDNFVIFFLSNRNLLRVETWYALGQRVSCIPKS